MKNTLLYIREVGKWLALLLGVSCVLWLPLVFLPTKTGIVIGTLVSLTTSIACVVRVE